MLGYGGDSIVEPTWELRLEAVHHLELVQIGVHQFLGLANMSSLKYVVIRKFLNFISYEEIKLD